MANDYLLEKQVLSGRDLCGRVLQTIVLSRAYSVALKYTAFDCQSTPSNSPIPIGDKRADPLFALCIDWERHCSWPLRLGQIYERLEVSRCSARHPFRFGGTQIPCRSFVLTAKHAPSTVTLCGYGRAGAQSGHPLVPGNPRCQQLPKRIGSSVSEGRSGGRAPFFFVRGRQGATGGNHTAM